MSRDRNALDLWLDGVFAGQLFRGETDQVEFIYDEAYRHDRDSTPLSVIVPKSRKAHGPDVIMPWLSNLLPDANEVRDRWAAKFGETKNDPFTLLRYMGQDAPGSVQVVPVGVIPSQAGSFSKLSGREIAGRIQGVIQDPDHWVDDTDDDESRFSLGGNQGKFALANIDKQWFEPNGRAASTHIIKPGMVAITGRTNAEVQAVEFVTMRAARNLGIPTAHVEIHDFDGLKAFVTKRYDRISRDGTTVRIHQEDFCQSLGVLPTRKYEEDGGPTAADMVSLVQEQSSQRFVEQDRHNLAKLFSFNLLVAGTDAHAKNHSLLLFGEQTRLAPAYDLISVHGIWNEERIKFKSSAAMKYGKERRYRNITGRNLARTADVLKIERSKYIDSLQAMAHQLPDAFESAVAELPDEFITENIVCMPDRVRSFASDISNRASMNDLRATPIFEAERSRLVPNVHHSVWIAGHWSGNTWITGHYRSRSRR